MNFSAISPCEFLTVSHSQSDKLVATLACLGKHRFAVIDEWATLAVIVFTHSINDGYGWSSYVNPDVVGLDTQKRIIYA